MRQFSNNTYAPSLWMQGLYCNLSFGPFGLDYFTENVLDLDIHISRVSVKPFFKLKIPYLKEVIIGFTAAKDDDNKNLMKKFSKED